MTINQPFKRDRLSPATIGNGAIVKVHYPPVVRVDNSSDPYAKESKFVPLDSVNLWKENARLNNGAVPKLARILLRHGQVTPAVVWRKNNVIYKGNTTWKSLDYLRNMPSEQYTALLEELKLDKNLPKPSHIYCLFVDFRDEKSAVDYGLADNKASEWSMWDEDKLEMLVKKYYEDIDKMEKSGGITHIGFTKEELKNLTMIPDIDKVKMSTSTKSLDGMIKLKCDAQDRDALRDWLLENLEDNGFKNVQIV